MNEILDFLLSPNTKAYSQSITIFFATLLILLIFKKFFEGIFKKRAENTENKIDDAMSEVFKQIKSPLIIIFGLYAASLTFDFSNSLEKIFSLIFQGSLILQILLLSQAFIKLSFEVYLQTNKNRSKELKTLFDYITKFLVFILWIIGILLFLSNAGYNISSLIASLGIGGLAIALAVQNILKDILSTVMILINKPFQVGDYVKLSPTEQGTITKIGMRNTIIKTIDSEELIVTNDDMLNSRIINFRNKNKRRGLRDWQKKRQRS